MQVHVVRRAQAGCEPQCPEWIAAQGRIDAAALKQFKKVLSQLGQRQLPVLVDSGGGSVKDAFAIGRLVRAKGLDVVVTRTAYTPCAPTDAACRKSKTGGALRGMPQALFAKCASSCAFILAAGTRRLVGPSTFVGVHQISYFRILRTYRVLTRRAWGEPVKTHKTLISEQKIPQKTAPQSSYADIKDYFAEMGIGESIMPLITSTPSDKIHWLTDTERVAFDRPGDRLDGWRATPSRCCGVDDGCGRSRAGGDQARSAIEGVGNCLRAIRSGRPCLSIEPRTQ